MGCSAGDGTVAALFYNSLAEFVTDNSTFWVFGGKVSLVFMGHGDSFLFF
jgi:hypothetical protein